MSQLVFFIAWPNRPNLFILKEWFWYLINAKFCFVELKKKVGNVLSYHTCILEWKKKHQKNIMIILLLNFIQQNLFIQIFVKLKFKINLYGNFSGMIKTWSRQPGKS
jgi:hypothetical protein